MPEAKRCEVVSWRAVESLAHRLAAKVLASGYRPELIVAIGRGGYVPGRLLSDWLGIMDLTSFKIEHYRHAEKQHAARVRYPLAEGVAGRRVLLVDDVADSGETFVVARDHLEERGPPAELRSAVLHYKTASPYRPDFFARTVRDWRWILYPWALMEDAGGFIRAMQPPPASIEEAARRLEAERGLRLPRRVLSELFATPTAPV
jgi:hypothetical protein